MGVFQGDDHKYVVNSNFDKQLISNERWQDKWGGTKILIYFKLFWLSSSNQNLVQSKKTNGFYNIAYTINIPIIPWI